jgi:ATP-dependent protease ClpP protease subunit
LANNWQRSDTEPTMHHRKTEFWLSFAANICQEQANHLRTRVATILERQDFGSLVILFSSDGGSTDQSLALHNFLIGLPVPVHMHAMGHIGSASIPVYLAGCKRTAAPLSRFFFHEYDWGFDGRQTLRRIDEAVKRLRNDIEMAREIIKARTNAGTDVFDALDGTAAPAILNAEQAKSIGLVDEVCELRQPISNGMPITMWT